MGHLAVVAVLAGLQLSGGLQQQDLDVKGPDRDQKRFVAWLISGQVSRFIYKDSSRFIDGGLRGWSGCVGYARGDCPMSVDVHIALANTHVAQFYGPRYALPTYEDGAFEESAVASHYSNMRLGAAMQQKVALIKDEFRGSGAREVRVRILSGEQFEENAKTFRGSILTRAKTLAQDMNNMNPEQFDRFWRKMPGHYNRFEQNGNMMLLRHLAYGLAVEAERSLPYKYTHVLYTREDNIFVHPPYTLLQLARDMDSGAEPSRSPASVLVDSHCGWKAWSDKLYFASRRGIDILIARTAEAHASQMARWINMAPTSKVSRDPLMTEEYFKRLLEDAHANVTKFDFARTEARYTQGAQEPCIPDLYFQCTSVAVFPACPSSGPPPPRSED